VISILPGGREKVRAPAVVVDVAQGQHGVVARRQLLAAGVSSQAVGRMIASGWLVRMHPGVYAVAGIPHSPQAHWMAAVLAGGPRALLSHASGAALWRIVDPIPGPVHVTTPGGRHRRRGIVFHRDPGLDRAATVNQRIRVTTPSRTILDLAGALSAGRLERALEAADRHALLDVGELTRLCDAARGRKGTARLRLMLVRYRPLPEARSELERRFLRLCRESVLPQPAVNVPVAGLEVDFLWPEQRLVVELDGFEFHRGRASFERDRSRDATLQLAGYRVLRLTYRRLVDEPHGVVADVSRALASARR
jgi:very-short-patch-repair endonuclease/predicted transcriptional regulator of viral defense system